MTQLKSKSLNPTPDEITESLKRFVYNEVQSSVEDLQLRAVCDAFLRKIDDTIPLFDYTKNVVAIHPKGFELLKLAYSSTSVRFPSMIKFRLVENESEMNNYRLRIEDYPEDSHGLVTLSHSDEE